MHLLSKIAHEIRSIPDYSIKGKVSAVKGLVIFVNGLSSLAALGAKCEIITQSKRRIIAEIIALMGQDVLLMPYQDISGIRLEDPVYLREMEQFIYPTPTWLGRVINALGEPIDNKGPLDQDPHSPISLKASAPPAHMRARVGAKLDTGIKAINTFLSLCKGQRMGIFAGSGVGKSMLIAMLAKYAATDVKVIGLIGERGREVQEFLEDYLGEEGLRKSVVIVSTSDESPLLKRRAAYLTMSIAEFFSKQQQHVLCMMDSVTRFAMAIREIGLSAGEPPTTKGYTPSVFSELPQLLERSGAMPDNWGAITSLFSVLVEGDDHNEPVADTVRGIIDGHIVLTREIAARYYPAIDILNSVSRMIPKCNNSYENDLITKAKSLLATYADMADMVRIGAYKAGSDSAVDEAIKYYPRLEKFLSQQANMPVDLEECYAKLAHAIEFEPTKPIPS